MGVFTSLVDTSGTDDRDQRVTRGLPTACLVSIPPPTAFSANPSFGRGTTVLSSSAAHIDNPDGLRSPVPYRRGKQRRPCRTDRTAGRDETTRPGRYHCRFCHCDCGATSNLRVLRRLFRLSCRRISPAVKAASKRCSSWHVWPVTALHPSSGRHRTRGFSAMPVFAGVEASLCLPTAMSAAAGRVWTSGDAAKSRAITVSANAAAARCLNLTAGTPQEATACHRGFRS